MILESFQLKNFRLEMFYKKFKKKESNHKPFLFTVKSEKTSIINGSKNTQIVHPIIIPLPLKLKFILLIFTPRKIVTTLQQQKNVKK